MVSYLRESDHDGSTVLLSDHTSKLLLALLNGLEVILAHGWVVLRHLSSNLQPMHIYISLITDQFQKQM